MGYSGKPVGRGRERRTQRAKNLRTAGRAMARTLQKTEESGKFPWNIRYADVPSQKTLEKTLEVRMPPIIDPEKCTGCGTCAQICPVQVFRFHRAEEKTPRPVFGEECWHCNCCVEDCPAGAIRLRVPVPYMMVHVDADTLKPARIRHDGN